MFNNMGKLQEIKSILMLNYHMIDICKFDQIFTYCHTQVCLDAWPCVGDVQSLEVQPCGCCVSMGKVPESPRRDGWVAANWAPCDICQ